MEYVQVFYCSYYTWTPFTRVARKGKMKNIFDCVDWILIVVPAVAVMVAEAMVDGLQVIDIVLGVAIGVIIAAFILWLDR